VVATLARAVRPLSRITEAVGRRPEYVEHAVLRHLIRRGCRHTWRSA